MIQTTALTTELTEVPIVWVFENYLKLPEKLMGQSLMILSPFNAKDKRPSCSIFIGTGAKNMYLFRDFSTGKSGDNVSLVKSLFNYTSRGEAAHRIIEDYNKWLLLNNDMSVREFKVQQRYKVTSHTKRSWTMSDQKYWTKFHIGSKLLERFHVSPLESYVMSRENEDGITNTLNITGRSCIYGFFRADGTLYKIYQPLVSDIKFIKVRDYIQGSDQLTYKKKYLVINSSLKDLMFFEKLGYEEAESIAPDSENTLIPEHVMNSYKLKYKGICTLFDNDDAGKKAMAAYKEKYNVNGALLPLSKDLSDSGRDHGVLKVKEILTPILKAALK